MTWKVDEIRSEQNVKIGPKNKPFFQIFLSGSNWDCVEKRVNLKHPNELIFLSTFITKRWWKKIKKKAKILYASEIKNIIISSADNAVN